MTITPVDFMADFNRLAEPLRAMELDWNYYKTRKLLEPNWDGYDMPHRNHDVIRLDVPLSESNLVTSHHRDDPDTHRVVLDLDYGVTTQPGLIGPTRLTLNRYHQTRGRAASDLAKRLNQFPLEASVVGKYVHLEPLCDYALIPSSTRGHYHLILAADMPYASYAHLIRLLAECAIIETGYYRAFSRRGCTTIRPPWIRKPSKDTPALF